MENKLPEGWEWKKLGEIAIVEKKVILPEDIKGTYQKYIGLENIEKDTGRLTGFSETLGDEIKSNKYRFTVENILYGKLRPYLNKVYLPDFEGICSTDILTIKTVKGKAIRKYVALLMRQPFFVSYANTRSSGANLPRINESKVLECKVPVPSLETQKKIVDILEKAEETKKLRAQADELTQKLLQSVFLEMFGDPTRNTRNWETLKFREVGTLERGKSKHRPRNAPELLGGKYPLVQTGNVANSGGYITEYTQTYSELGLKQSKMWPVGTLCITIAANIAKTGILTFEACFPDSVVGFTPNEKVKTEYIQHWMSFLQKMLEDSAPESAQKNINLKILSDLNTPVPSLELQEKFASIVQLVEKNKKSQIQSSLEINNLFDVLMQKAFTGELVS